MQGVGCMAPVLSRLKAIATSGLTPHQLVLTLCIGGAMGLLPLIWGTSLLCLAIGRLFRLNQLVLQAVNYLLYPVQLALLFPFCKLGAVLFPWGPMHPAGVMLAHSSGPMGGRISFLFWMGLKALAAWLLIVPPVCLLTYLCLVAVFIRKPKTTGGQAKLGA